MVLWCLLTGRVHAWDGANGRMYGWHRLRVINEDARPDCSTSAIRADAPPALVALMKHAWAKNPATRPSAADAANTLATLRAESSTQKARDVANIV